ncbi:hypothetical protein [Algoriphagus aquimarinus]|uniref:Glycosyltransferase RgtA/B/C/D-like domain-containing protein n=1 Tax=Algoriphagus aquimarinus TaxID=237018 RepID=A0A1I1CFY7_9BACT|nr:hypothetical protein [Algoriphagus aquimarinus]SFB61474.1 hypothetical protein SAMN04489723_1352 [Algoriphagus aquimarinus]
MIKLLASFTSLSLLLILFAVNRGFDISDEGLYALLVVPEQQNSAGIFNYDLFFKLFYKITGIEFGIIGLRLLRLVLYVLAAISLTSFWKTLAGSAKLSIQHFFISLLGIFAGYAFLPQSLSYNSLSVVITCFWLALISQRNKTPAHYFLIGLLLACMAYTKITASLGLGLLTIFWLIYAKDIKLTSVLGLILPFAIIELTMYLVLGEFAFARILDARQMMAHRSEYSFLLLFKYTAVGCFWLVLVAIPFFFSGKLRASAPKLKYTMLFIALILLVCIGYYTAIAQEWNHIVLLLTVAFLAYLAPRLPFASIPSHQRYLLATLLVLPFLLHLGSNVYWLRLGIHYWVFWLIAAFYLGSLIDKSLIAKMSLAVGGFTLVLVANGIWIHPFQQEPLWKATQEWTYGHGKNIKLTEKQIEVLTAVEPLVQEQEQLLAFYRIPGIAYLLNKKSPKSPGFWTKSQTEYFFPSGYQAEVLLFYSLDSLPSFVKSDFSKTYVQLPDGEELQILWRK